MLVFPGGSEIGLEILRGLRWCKEVLVFSAGVPSSNHAPFEFRRHFEIPSIHEEGWLDALVEVVRSEAIDFIYPAHDDVIVALTRNAEKIPCRIIGSCVETCILTRSKSRTYRRLEGVVPTPKLFADVNSVRRYPVFVKPDEGQGSERTAIARNRAELERAVSKDPSAIIVEYLPGREFTIDCFSDRERGLLFAGGRERIRIKAGISVASRPMVDPMFQEYASRIASHIDLRGAWFFQLKRSASGEYKLLEIGPRIAGTMALHRVAGVNFALLSIFEAERMPIAIIPQEGALEISRCLANRYQHRISFKMVYLDLDDTLIVRGEVYPEMVGFIFQCLNKGIGVKLMTRHGRDLQETLRLHRLEGLFDEVIVVPDGRKKSDFVRDGDAIFVDDSFKERMEVREALGIPTFDGSMLELLIDERS